jgi:ribose 5-phosphate isomerase B
MKVAIGADHAGFEVKEKIKKLLDEMQIPYEDVGTNSTEPVDYPDFGAKVGRKVASGEADQGIVVCGSGIGIAIAANKIRGVRAAQAWNEETARLARQHNDANVLAIGAKVLPEEEILKIIRAWFSAGFDGGRHERRIEKIKALEENLETSKEF